MPIRGGHALLREERKSRYLHYEKSPVQPDRLEPHAEEMTSYQLLSIAIPSPTLCCQQSLCLDIFLDVSTRRGGVDAEMAHTANFNRPIAKVKKILMPGYSGNQPGGRYLMSYRPHQCIF